MSARFDRVDQAFFASGRVFAAFQAGFADFVLLVAELGEFGQREAAHTLLGLRRDQRRLIAVALVRRRVPGGREAGGDRDRDDADEQRADDDFDQREARLRACVDRRPRSPRASSLGGAVRAPPGRAGEPEQGDDFAHGEDRLSAARSLSASPLCALSVRRSPQRNVARASGTLAMPAPR